MKENKFQTKLKKVLESQCAFVINFHGHLLQRAGLPDLEVIHRRWHGFLELKCGKNKASALQRSVAAAIELRGVPCYVLRCVEQSKDGIPSDGDYTIEDFDGKVLWRMFNLGVLLLTLAGLDSHSGFDEVD